MHKVILFLNRKEGMSREAFIRRYEEGHAPLIVRLTPFFSDYRRSYVIPGSVTSQAGTLAEGVTFDVITEAWVESEAMARLARVMAETDAPARIAEDETHLFNRRKLAMFACDEYVTAPDLLAPRPAGHDGRPAVTMVCLSSKRPGMSREGFLDYYETRHAPLAQRLLVRDGRSLFAGYRRTCLQHDGRVPVGEADAPPLPVDFDEVTAISFWTEKDYRYCMELCARPEIAETLARDEEKFVDRSSIRYLLAEEYVTPRAELDAAAASLAS